MNLLCLKRCFTKTPNKIPQNNVHFPPFPYFQILFNLLKTIRGAANRSATQRSFLRAAVNEGKVKTGTIIKLIAQSSG